MTRLPTATVVRGRPEDVGGAEVMGEEATTELVNAIQRSQLLEPAQLKQLTGDLQGRFADPRALGKHLIDQGWLTPYQINQLLHGQAVNLTLGPYRIVERLGSGGMGQVFKARHQQLNRVVALKVIRPESLVKPNAIKRFQREAQAAAQVTHPNIVTLYDAGEVNGIHFLAMEYVDGVDLGALVKQSGPLPVAQAVEYVRQAAIGLQHAHERGLIHRDIKPSNLLLTRVRGERPAVVKVLDLGVARLDGQEAAEPAELTQEGSVMGTPDFMAPEQAKNSRRVDRRADLYSLGCTLYYLLTGKPPFPDGTVVEKLLYHQLEEAPPVEKLRPDTPRAVVKVLRRLMAKRPQDRYASAADAAAALAATANAVDPPQPRRRKLIWAAVMLGGLAIISLGSAAAWYALTPDVPAVAPAAPTTRVRVDTDDNPSSDFWKGKGGKGPRPSGMIDRDKGGPPWGKGGPWGKDGPDHKK